MIYTAAVHAYTFSIYFAISVSTSGKSKRKALKIQIQYIDPRAQTLFSEFIRVAQYYLSKNKDHKWRRVSIFEKASFNEGTVFLR